MANAERIFGHNLDYPWNEFDAESYFQHNYARLRADDRRILEVVRDFFVEAFAATPLPEDAQGIDVGTGANLSPALAMLPFCDSVTLYEFSDSNIQWLKDQRSQGWPSWDSGWSQVWELLCERAAYQAFDMPRAELSKRTEIVQGNVLEFRLREPAQRWDVGTMFFVAESITRRKDEFRSALGQFLAALKADAPFAMTFMEHSVGYEVGPQKFPAIDIGRRGIRKRLRRVTRDLSVVRVPIGDEFLRSGYTGMIIAHGRVKNRVSTRQKWLRRVGDSWSIRRRRP